MASVKSFDKKNLPLIRADIKNALEAVETKYGIKLSLGNISFTDETFGGKLSAVTMKATGGKSLGNAKWNATFLKNYAQLGLKKTDLGRTFDYKNEKVTIVGARSHAITPLIVQKENDKFICIGAQYAK